MTTAHPEPGSQPAGSGDPVRGTQSLVFTLGDCWRRPSLLALELTWRWLYGIPALLLLFVLGRQVAAATSLESTGIYSFSLQDPWRAAVVAQDTFAMLWPPVRSICLWLLPLLAITWAIVSGIGRNLVLRRYDPSLPARPAVLIALQFLRVVALGATFAVWFGAVRWSAAIAFAHDEPNLVLYFALVICLTLAIFSLWALLSWIFYAAPLLALLEGRGVFASLRRSVSLGPLRGKMIEVNMVMGIVKLALIVLAMVFSATPLPFQSVMAGTPLYVWWSGVTLLYLAASDFFQVARLVAFIELWRAFRPHS